MDVFEGVRTMVAVRSFRSDPVPDDVLGRIVEAGRLTASSMNKQPWHFVVVREPDMIRELAGMATTGPYIAQAPLVIVVAMERTPYALSDVSRAIQSMMLTAWADGIGSNWVGCAGMKKVGPALGIPVEFDVAAVLPFGYPVRPAKQGSKVRKPLAEIVHDERFGRPFGG